MKRPDYTLEMAVRDYECDLQGIVNNSVYQNYFEHVRHEYLKTIGIDFKDYTDRGIHLVVVRAEIDYKNSLTSGDAFTVTLRLKRESKLRFAFFQEIIRQPDSTLAVAAKIIGTALNTKGRPHIPEEFERILSPSNS